MKFLLLLWATGALGGPCKPSGPRITHLTDMTSPSGLSHTDTRSLSSALSSGWLPTRSLNGTSFLTEATPTSWLPSGSINGGAASDSQSGISGSILVSGSNDGARSESQGTETATQNEPVSNTDSATILPTNSGIVLIPSNETSLTLSGSNTEQSDGTGTKPVGQPTGTSHIRSESTGNTLGAVTSEDTASQTNNPQPDDTQAASTHGSVILSGDETATGISSTTMTGSLGASTGLQSQETESGLLGTATVPGNVETDISAIDTFSPIQSHETTQNSDIQTGTSAAGSTSESDNTEPVPSVTGSTGNPETDSTALPKNTNSASGTTGSDIPSSGVTDTSALSESQSLGSAPNDTGSDSVPLPSNTETDFGTQPQVTVTDATTQNGSSEPVSTGIERNSATRTEGTPETTEPSEISQLEATETGNTSQAQETDQSQGPSHSESETDVIEEPQNTQESLVSSQVSENTSTDSIDVKSTEASIKPTSTDSIPLSTSAVNIPISTEAPSVTSRQPTSTGSYTAAITTVPDRWSPTCVSGHTEWTANTWITTTSEGSSSETVVPVLVDTDECDSDDSGLILFGFLPITGALFKLPGAPKFSLPCIPPGCSLPPTSEPSGGEDGDDDSEDESSKSKESSGTCTDTSTASNCLVKCTTSTGAIDASITSQCITTCSETATGCSVTGMTSTTEVDACSATGDKWSTEGCGVCSDDEDSEADVENKESKSSDLRKRWAEKKQNDEGSSVGQCKNLPTTFYFPWYPQGNDVFLVERQLTPANVNSPFKDIGRWYQKQHRDCKVELAGPLKWPETGSVEEFPSIDHVFEKSFLRDYWREITSTNPSIRNVHGTTPRQVRNKITCDDLIFYGSTGQTDMSFIKDVYKVYPGATKPSDLQKIQPNMPHDLRDFIGTDGWTNDAKGATTSPYELGRRMRGIESVDLNSDINSILTTIEARIEVIEMLIIGVKLISLDLAQDIMIRQNSRIYKALQDIDKNAKRCKNDPAVKSGKWSFADRYKSFMLRRFDGTHAQSINPAIARAFQQLWLDIPKDIVTASKVGPNTKFVNTAAEEKVSKKYVRLRNTWVQLQGDYGVSNPTAPSIPVPAWEWNMVTKRDDDNEDSCHIQTTTQEATTLSTIISKSETEQDGTTDHSSTSTSISSLCSSDDDCESTSCEDDEIPICGNGPIQPPGIPKVCRCVEKTVTTTEAATSSADETEPTITNIGLAVCSSNDDCEDFECEEGESPMCGTGSEIISGVPKLCHCVKGGEDDEPASTTAEDDGPAPTTTEAPEETDEPDPNADVPEMECGVHADCEEWEGVCDGSNSIKVCQATGWTTVDGVPTSTKSTCGCSNN